MVASTWTKRFYKLPSVFNCKLATRGDERRQKLRSLFETSSNVSTSLYLTLLGTYNNRKISLMSQQGRSFSNFDEERSSRNLRDLGVEEKARDRLKRRFITLATCLACISFHRDRGGSRKIRKIFVGRSLTTESTGSGHTFAQLLAVALAASGSSLNGTRQEKRIVTG